MTFRVSTQTPTVARIAEGFSARDNQAKEWFVRLEKLRDATFDITVLDKESFDSMIDTWPIASMNLVRYVARGSQIEFENAQTLIVSAEKYCRTTLKIDL